MNDPYDNEAVRASHQPAHAQRHAARWRHIRRYLIRRAGKGRPRARSAWAHCLAWLCLVYGTNGFVYGLANNVEELPAIYHVAGVADYPHDPMVAALVSHWNQATPYIYVLAGLVNLTGTDGSPALFFLLHAALMALTYMSLRTILRGLCRCTETTVLLSALALIGIDHWSLLPGKRMLLFHFMDPEHVSIVFCLAAVAGIMANRWKTGAIHISLATIIHPLYGLPMIGSFWLVAIAQSLTRQHTWGLMWQRTVLCGAVGLPYSLFVWACDLSDVPAAFDVSRIQELIRSPGCHVIPQWHAEAFWHAWALPAILAAGAWSASRMGKPPTFASERTDALPDSEPRTHHMAGDLTIIVAALLFYMFAASIIDGIVRVPLVVKLTPYRMAVVAVPLLGFLTVSVMANRWHGPVWFRQPAFRLLLGAGLAITSMNCVARARSISCALVPHTGGWLNDTGSEVIRFVRAKTDRDAVFLNYSDIDLRTACLRSEAFRFKTIPLYAEAQLVWYRRLLAVNTVSQDIAEFDYERVRDYIRTERVIRLTEVLQRLNLSVEYIVVQRAGPFVDRFASCNGQGNLMRFDAHSLTTVLENEAYVIYHVPAESRR